MESLYQSSILGAQEENEVTVYSDGNVLLLPLQTGGTASIQCSAQPAPCTVG